ncbi:MAG TPA: hypothetical protein VF350_03400 [Candidatus Bathyarchaeia archaeon]
MSNKSKLPKQFTLDDLPNSSKEKPSQIPAPIHIKRIIITEIDTLTKEDELALKVGFTLVPSKNSFSKLKLDLWLTTNKSSPFQ